MPKNYWLSQVDPRTFCNTASLFCRRLNLTEVIFAQIPLQKCMDEQGRLCHPGLYLRHSSIAVFEALLWLPLCDTDTRCISNKKRCSFFAGSGYILDQVPMTEASHRRSQNQPSAADASFALGLDVKICTKHREEIKMSVSP